MKMDIEQLEVESFETAAAHGRGTVLGRMPEMDTCREVSSPRCEDTPLASCDGGCGPDCGAAKQEPV